MNRPETKCEAQWQLARKELKYIICQDRWRKVVNRSWRRAIRHRNKQRIREALGDYFANTTE